MPEVSVQKHSPSIHVILNTATVTAARKIFQVAFLRLSPKSPQTEKEKACGLWFEGLPSKPWWLGLFFDLLAIYPWIGPPGTWPWIAEDSYPPELCSANLHLSQAYLCPFMTSLNYLVLFLKWKPCLRFCTSFHIYFRIFQIGPGRCTLHVQYAGTHW